MSVLFGLLTQVAPIPESWKPAMTFTFVVLTLLSVIGWLDAHQKERKTLTGKLKASDTTPARFVLKEANFISVGWCRFEVQFAFKNEGDNPVSHFTACMILRQRNLEGETVVRSISLDREFSKGEGTMFRQPIEGPQQNPPEVVVGFYLKYLDGTTKKYRFYPSIWLYDGFHEKLLFPPPEVEKQFSAMDVSLIPSEPKLALVMPPSLTPNMEGPPPSQAS